MSTEKGTYQAPAGAAVPVKGSPNGTQPCEERRNEMLCFGEVVKRCVAQPFFLLRVC